MSFIQAQHMIDPNTRMIFLDIDGVLNHSGYFKTALAMQELDPIDPECIKNLNAIVEQTGANIVISSSWRMMADIETITNLLKDKGFIGRVIGGTPDIYKTHSFNAPRGCEIKKWIDDNIDDKGLISYKKYIIIDDDSDMLLEQAEHFIHTTFDSGLTQSLAYRATLKLLSLENIPDFNI